MKIYSIQYLRAIAALMVAANHIIVYPYNIETGQQGVDIFFVISGFIMIYIMEQNQRSWSDFLISRYFRIAPLYYLVTFFAILIGFINLPNILHSLQALTFIKFYKSAPPLSVGWTLEYEFIFYFLCGASLFVFKKQINQIIFIIITLICLALIIDFIIFSEKKYGHFIEFGYGVIIYLIYKLDFLRKIHYSNYILFLFLGFFLLIYSDISVYKNNFTYLRFIYWGLPSFLIVLSFLLLEDRIYKSKFLLYLGDASYSIYLTHLPIIFILENSIGFKRYDSTRFEQILVLFIVILIACLTHTYIEKKMSNFLKSNFLQKKQIN